MKGLQGKCLVASAVTHGLLLLMLLIGSAFIPHKPVEEAIAITLIDFDPDILVDDPNIAGGGGNPRAGLPNTQPETPTPVPEPAREVPAPQTQPQVPAEVPRPEPVIPTPRIPEPERETKPPEPKFNLSEAVTKKAAPVRETKTAPSFDFSKAERKVIRPSSTKNNKSVASTEENASSARDNQLARALGSGLSRLQNRLSSGVGEIGVPGPGGASYASYGLYLRKIYEEAWRPPQAASGNEPLVEVEVTIARDGTVLSHRIVKRSGKRDLDRSVEETLNRVKKVREFPSGSKDDKRVFKINFNLNTRPGIG